MDLTVIFYNIDNFCKQFDKWLANRCLMVPGSERKHRNQLTDSEIMSILIYYAANSQDFKHFKAFYHHKYKELKGAFPNLVSYGRMIELKQLIELKMVVFLMTLFSDCTGISYVDSSKIQACHNKRANRHKTLRRWAKWGKTGDGWFYGFKIHAAVNHQREIINMCITPGNIADNNEYIIHKLSTNLLGKIFGDKGYILNEELWQEIYSQGLQFISNIRANMKPQIMPILDKILLKKRTSIIETFFGILKDKMSLQYTRVRSPYGFICNIVSMLVAYQLKVTKKCTELSSTLAIGYISAVALSTAC